MRILITNDDGFWAEGIRALAQAAIERGHEVVISAPATQCSANSQHINISHPLLVKEMKWEGATAFAVEGTPGDCARLGPFLTENRHFDFCLSGINRGDNTGSAVYYSGTAAAAREAAMAYIPSMAVSIQFGATWEMYLHLARVAVKLAEQFEGEKLPRFTFINLNGPNRKVEEMKEMVLCPLSQGYFLDTYQRRESPAGRTYYWVEEVDTANLPIEPAEPGSDRYFLQEGHITCSFVGHYGDENPKYAEKMQEIMK